MSVKFGRRRAFTVFTDGAALLRLVDGVDALRHSAVGHHAVHLVIWFAAAPLAGRRLWAEKQEARVIWFVK